MVCICREWFVFNIWCFKFFSWKYISYFLYFELWLLKIMNDGYPESCRYKIFFQVLLLYFFFPAKLECQNNLWEVVRFVYWFLPRNISVNLFADRKLSTSWSRKRENWTSPAPGRSSELKRYLKDNVTRSRMLIQIKEIVKRFHQRGLVIWYINFFARLVQFTYMCWLWR